MQVLIDAAAGVGSLLEQAKEVTDKATLIGKLSLAAAASARLSQECTRLSRKVINNEVSPSAAGGTPDVQDSGSSGATGTANA